MNQLDKIVSCFPQSIQQQIWDLSAEKRAYLEEIRVYKEKEVQLFVNGTRIPLQGHVTGNAIKSILNNLMKHSYYAYEEDLAKGFITIDGGHRVGICGKAVLEQGRVTLLREISSFNIRCGKEVIGCSDKIMTHILHDGKVRNVLILSPPGCGKTTMLRDIARNLSHLSYKVAICDERSELAAMHEGTLGYQFGPMVDVLDGCPKAVGMLMLIRSMAPDVIIADEIGASEDWKAIETCSHCGVSVITSAHGYSLADVFTKYFDTVIILKNKPQPGSIKEIIHV